MPKHEIKDCPRCGQPFECKLGNITQCQCFQISFTEYEKGYIDSKYQNCLCRECLLALKRELT